MRSTTRAIAALACASLMTACGGGGASPIASAPLTESASRTPDVAPDTTSKCTPKIYVGDYQNNDVLIYPGNVMNPGPCGKIKTGIDAPLGVAVDYDDGVYVANYLSDSSGGYPINEFLNGTKTPTVTIEADGPGYDLWVGKGRVLYVAEATRSAVAEYGYASTVPKATLAVNGEPYGVATDQKNNLYVSYLSNADGVGHVEEFAPGATTGTDAGFTVPLGGALRIDSQRRPDRRLCSRRDDARKVLVDARTPVLPRAQQGGNESLYRSIWRRVYLRLCVGNAGRHDHEGPGPSARDRDVSAAAVLEARSAAAACARRPWRATFPLPPGSAACSTRS